VLSKNLHRRHLSISQLGVIGMKATPMFREEAKERQREGGGIGGSSKLSIDRREASLSIENKGRSSEKAAEMVGVSPSVVQRAIRIQKEAPEQIERIERGEVTVDAAYREVVTPENGKRQLMLENADIAWHRRFSAHTILTVRQVGICPRGINT
jgi:DNA-binding transcriptional regulator YdaS (Cro superfamily)